MHQPALTPDLAPVRVALMLANEAGSWDGVRMQDVARVTGLSLSELLREYPDRDALADACFDVADAALLAQSDDPAWPQLGVCIRLHRAVLAWLDALPPQAVLRGMVGYKVQPEHVHLQARAVMRVSRTVQTLREVALLRATGWRREVEEAALTSLWLATFGSWLFDSSPGAQRTRTTLWSALAAAHRIGGWSG